MTFTIKIRGDVSKSLVAVYTCPVHGAFDAEVQRDESGGAPELITCEARDPLPGDATVSVMCCLDATWTPTPVACRVRRIEAVKGKWEKPEKKTYLDTRELAEGMDIDDFHAKRAAVWEEKRQEDVMAVKKGFG
jgi:hypothetical protein